MQVNRKKSLLDGLIPLKVYSFSDLGLDGNNPSHRSSLSRSKADIVKLGKGKFYVSNQNRSMVYIHRAAHDKISIKRGSAKASSIHASKNLFWSNPNGYIPIKNIIASVIKNGSIDDINSIIYRFGEHRVIEVLLNNFDMNEPKMKRIAYVLDI